MLSMITSTRPSQATCFSYFTLNKKSLLVSTICCVSTVAEAPISHSTSISSFNININSPVDANSSRRSGNYKPTTWDFEYIQSIKNDYVGEEYMERLNKLKKEMQKMLLMMVVEDHEELDQLKLIDNLQRLGVSYHFKEEIMQILRSSHHKSTINADNSLYSTALKFRLLREHGFDISQDILKNFKDEDGNLKESTYNDTNGLLELYEASFFSTETETNLKNATSLTVSHLKKYLDDNNNHEENDEVMVDLVQHALELPRHWMMQRLETIWYINIYERMSNPNPLLLELAKLDFNIVQDAHQQELRTLSRFSMTSFNPLSAILGQNKLEGHNYVDWKRNLDIVLTVEEYKYVLTEECPEKPDDDADEAAKTVYAKWLKADEMARCYILASVSNVLQHQHQNMASAYEMLESLKQMFGDQSRSAKQTAMKALMSTKMAEGTSVQDHVLKMMSYLNELEVLGAEIDNDSQVEMVLQSLPDSFQQFRLNYNMNKMSMSLALLLNELQAAEAIIKEQAPTVAMVVEKAPSSSKPKGGQKKKKKTQGAKAVGGPNGGVKKPKGKCFHCKQPGHWKQQCPVFKAKMKGVSDNKETK